MITRINAIGQTLGLTPEAIRTITAQAAHETNGFTSKVFLKANNLFGIRAHARKIKGKLNTLYNGYSTYQNPESSVVDLIDLCRRRRTIFALENIVEYAAILKKTDYYEADEGEYRKGMIFWYKKLFPESTHKYS
jgi:flagellum-specific peptidoglycan hydrolase FlgJ